MYGTHVWQRVTRKPDAWKFYSAKGRTYDRPWRANMTPLDRAQIPNERERAIATLVETRRTQPPPTYDKPWARNMRVKVPPLSPETPAQAGPTQARQAAVSAQDPGADAQLTAKYRSKLNQAGTEYARPWVHAMKPLQQSSASAAGAGAQSAPLVTSAPVDEVLFSTVLSEAGATVESTQPGSSSGSALYRPQRGRSEQRQVDTAFATSAADAAATARGRSASARGSVAAAAAPPVSAPDYSKPWQQNMRLPRPDASPATARITTSPQFNRGKVASAPYQVEVARQAGGVVFDSLPPTPGLAAVAVLTEQALVPPWRRAQTARPGGDDKATRNLDSHTPGTADRVLDADLGGSVLRNTGARTQDALHMQQQGRVNFAPDAADSTAVLASTSAGFGTRSARSASPSPRPRLLSEGSGPRDAAAAAFEERGTLGLELNRLPETRRNVMYERYMQRAHNSPAGGGPSVEDTYALRGTSPLVLDFATAGALRTRLC